MEQISFILILILTLSEKLVNFTKETQRTFAQNKHVVILKTPNFRPATVVISIFCVNMRVFAGVRRYILFDF